MTKQLSATPGQLQQHAQQLAQAFDVRLIECAQLEPHEGFAYGPRRCVFIHPVTDETTYAVALHELGHFLMPMGWINPQDAINGNVANLRRDEENAAWQWARHYALIWTPVMESVATWAEGTYAARAAQPQPSKAAPQAPAVPTPQINWSHYK